MTTIVRHKRTGNEYILLSINGEENKTNPSRFINELFNSNQAKAEISCSATVCDVQGNLFLAYIDDLIVIEIDGKNPADILPEPEYKSASNDSDRSQNSEFKDDEFDEEELEDEDEKVIVTPPESSSYSQNKPNNNDLEDNDDDWI